MSSMVTDMNNIMTTHGAAHQNNCDETVASVLSVASIVSLEELVKLSSSSNEAEPVKRRVSFSVQPVQVISSTSPLEILSLHERHLLWYEARDLEDFRTEARDLCRQMRTTTTTTDATTTTEAQHEEARAACVSLARDSQTRGLEQRSCLERQRRRYLSTKFIVKAQYKLTADRLAALSFKCTHWAAELAVEEAARDFVRAHVENETTTTTTAPAIDFTAMVSVHSNKREAVEEQHSRRVRERLSQC